MIKMFRYDSNDAYWDKRWDSAGVDQSRFKNLDIYPIRYCKHLDSDSGSILEAGCGNGRVYFHLDQDRADVYGLEYSAGALDLIKHQDPSARILQGSITHLPYQSSSFDYLLAFGLFHNIEDTSALQTAFQEAARVLKPGGKMIFSVRFHSLENRLIEWIVRSRNKGKVPNQFHRWHFEHEDILKFLGNDFSIVHRKYARNVPFLFKFDFMRHRDFKKGVMQESRARSEGFRLNGPASFLDLLLHGLFPAQFSNLMIYEVQKNR